MGTRKPLPPSAEEVLFTLFAAAAHVLASRSRGFDKAMAVEAELKRLCNTEVIDDVQSLVISFGANVLHMMLKEIPPEDIVAVDVSAVVARWEESQRP